MSRFGQFLLCLCVVVMGVSFVDAQSECGTLDFISYPVDTEAFVLAQDFGTASPRHQGRFHTGEDWFMVDGIGQPVRAVGTGRVTYSAPTGWGRDGGVIIIEHTLPDGEVIYSQYGHLQQTDAYSFPARLACVEAGEIIGAIGDSRPAPHLHFEMRVNNPDVPGPGYTRENPLELGWRQPAAVIMNLQAQLHRAYSWHTHIIGYDAAIPPLVLDDNSLLVLADSVLRRVTADGRVLWRVPLDQRAVSVTGFQASPLINYADGTLSRIDYDGWAEERWQIDFEPDSAPIRAAETLVFRTADGSLVALDAERREILWRLEDVPAYVEAAAGSDVIALVLEDGLWLVSRQGELLAQSELRHGADLATTPDGRLWVYTYGGLWRIEADGAWAQVFPDAARGGGAGAVAVGPDGRVYLTDGQQLYAYSRLGELDWEARLPQTLAGRSDMQVYDDIVLITSSHGHVITADVEGGFCGFTRVFGSDQTASWTGLGDDNVLRFAVGSTIFGFDWSRLTTCS